LSQYYNCKNKFFFIKNNFYGLRRYNAYAYAAIECLYKILKREHTIEITKKAIRDFLSNKTGKAI